MATLVCALCGTTVDDSGDEQSRLVALSWVTSYERDRELHYCPVCARANLRSIEGKLDVAFW